MARDTSFYYSFLVLPADQRRAIMAVWDFCRAVDDAADEARPGREERDVRRWREELARCYDGGAPETPQGRALQPLIAGFGLPRSAFDALIEGVEMDLYPRRYATFQDLYEYCIRVASAVGLLCVEIFGCRDQGSRQYAIDLGVALQLTNILRDVPGDFARDRVYIPREDFARFGCTEDDLASEIAHAGGGVRSTAIRALLAYQAARAREYYGRAAAVLPRSD
ncbi:MAG TPA: squalene/phytoene synthase family protein, partial [Vicinamibacterales bacterium]